MLGTEPGCNGLREAITRSNDALMKEKKKQRLMEGRRDTLKNRHKSGLVSSMKRVLPPLGIGGNHIRPFQVGEINQRLFGDLKPPNVESAEQFLI